MDRSGKCQSHQPHQSHQSHRSSSSQQSVKFATPHELNNNIQSRPITMKNQSREYKDSDTKELMYVKPRQNEFCLPPEREIKRRKELHAEFNRIDQLSDDTNNWLISENFQVSYCDRRNLSSLIKTCFNPVPFSSIGKKSKKLVLMRQERERISPKPIKLSESERFKHLDQSGNVGNALKEYIKARNKKLAESTSNKS